MLKRKLKKAFTLVELLVVIAILAILATVSVVGYTQFTKRAHLSNDQSTIGMINDNLRAASVGNEPESAGDALDLLYSVGFTSDKLEPYSAGYHYVYDLTDNMFYLVDDNDTIVYPEEKAIGATIWGLYRNRDTDKINGVTNYVALESITATNKAKFDAVFGGGVSYTLDLNSYFIGISPNATIALVNGSVGSDVAGSYTINENAGVSVRELYDSATGLQEDTGEISGYYFTSSNVTDTNALKNQLASAMNAEGELTIDSCTFDVSSTLDFKIDNAKTIIIENCTFISATSWTMNIGGTDRVYTIRNNSFQGARGINAQGLCSSGNLIENNEFRLLPNADGKAKALQLSDYVNRAAYENPYKGSEGYKGKDLAESEKNYDAYIGEGKTPWIIFKDNNIISADAVVNVHESMVYADRNSYYKSDGTEVGKIADSDTGKTARKENDLFVNDYYKAIIVFEGTNVSTNVSVKVAPDIPTYPYAENAELNAQENMDALVNYYNSIFQ